MVINYCLLTLVIAGKETIHKTLHTYVFFAFISSQIFFVEKKQRTLSSKREYSQDKVLDWVQTIEIVQTRFSL